MKKIGIVKLRDIYQSIAGKNNNKLFKKVYSFNYLNLSSRFSRDNRDFDNNNFKLLKKLFLNIDRIKLSKKNNIKISVYLKYLFSLKESCYLPSKKLPIIFFIDLLKYFKQILDIFGILILTITFILLNNLKFLNKNKLNFKNKKIYSIYYWTKKNLDSVNYYYPGIKENSKNKIFIASFADTKFISKGLLISLLKTNFITPAQVINNVELTNSILQFIHLYLFDLYSVFNRRISFLSFWFDWKKAAEIFYSILIYNSIIKLSKSCHRCEFISWYENHITNRAFALGVSFAQKYSSASSILSTFNGAIITENIPNYFLPTKVEYNIGFIGKKYYVQDESSKEEFENYIKSKDIDINVQKVPISMVRTRSSLEDKKYFEKSRFITIFTHSSYWDLIACILSLLNKKNKNLSLLREGFMKVKIIVIRLHPSLDKKIALEEIKKIKEIPNYITFKFINNKEETFIKSIKSTEYCFFGISIYVNLAIELNNNVVAVETSHIDKPPIKKSLLNSSKLQFALPW